MAIQGKSIGNEKKEGTSLPDNESTRLKSDYPLSEKDEVKQAEAKLGKAVKKRDQRQNG